MHVRAHVDRPKTQSPHGIFIELDEASATYAPGAKVTGRVVVRAAAHQVCEAFSIELQAHTHGKLKALATGSEQRLFSGSWLPGETYTYPFTLDAPIHARPYRGHLFNVELRVAAVMLAPGGRENPPLVERLTGISMAALHARAYPAAAAPIGILPETRPTYLSLSREHVARNIQNRGFRLLASLIATSIGLGGGAIALVIALSYFEIGPSLLELGEPWLAVFPAVFGLFFFFAGGSGCLAHLGPWMAERKIGVPHIQASQRLTAQENALDVTVRIRPRAGVSRVRAGFRLIESVHIVEGSTSRTIERVVGEQSFDLSRQTEPGLYAAALPIPPPGTTQTNLIIGAAKLVWHLTISAELPLWPDWKVAIPLFAFPTKATNPGKIKGTFTFN